MKKLSIFAAVLIAAAVVAFLPHGESAAQTPPASRTYLVDFGRSTHQSPSGNWNNIIDPRATSSTLELIDTNGAASPVSVRVSNSFYYDPSQYTDYSINPNGTTNSSLYPSNATRDTFFIGSIGCCNDSSAALTVGGLSSDKTYTFRFYASRMANDSTNRTTRYRINTTTVQLNARNNTNNTVQIDNVTTSTGSVTINISRASSGGYGYLGVLEIIEEGGTEPQNEVPVAHAGPDTSITLPTNSITATGSGTDADGTIASYLWTKVSGGSATIVSPNNASTLFDNLAEGTYVFRLTVTDNDGATDTDDMEVIVYPAPPTTGGGDVNFNFSSASVMVEGWANVSGDPQTATRSAINRSVGIGVRSLPGNWNNTNGNNAWDGFGETEDDGGGFAVPAQVMQGYWYNTASTFDGTYQLEIFGLDSTKTYDVSLFGSRGTTSGGIAPRVTDYNLRGATTLPTQTLDVFRNTSETANFESVQPNASGVIEVAVHRNPAGGNFGYLNALMVSESSNEPTPPENQAPSASAGSNQSITLPTNSVVLSGSGADADGTIASYAWTKVSGGTATIVSPSSATTTISGLVEGSYTFRLTVTDDDGATDTDDVSVTVQPEPNSCPAKKIVVLGSSTAAGYGISPLSNAWVYRYESYLDSRNSANSVVNLAVGGYTTYHILPTGASVPGNRPSPDASKNITAALAQNPHAIIVNMPSNDAANGYSLAEQQANFQLLASTAANAGVPIWFTTTQPRNMSQSERNNLMAMRDWILQTYGANAVNFFDPVANADGTIIWQYNQGDGIHLTAEGHGILNNQMVGNGLIDTLCSGTAPVPNQAPTANAGINQSITLPASSVSLSGSGSDTDGSIASYLWTKVSGGSATITSPTSAATNVTNLTEGSYTFRLTVTDDDGATDTDDVSVTVNPAPNQAPTANAGPDASTTLPANSVILSGSGTDADGTITSYAWTKVSGGTATIVSPSSATTTISGLVEGSYTFRLTVTDDDGATDTDDVSVTINPAPNSGPSVSAGLSMVTLAGSASDPDGSIASYLWTKVSGGSATIVSPNSATTSVTGLASGTYVFRLTVTDDDGATASADQTVTVN